MRWSLLLALLCWLAACGPPTTAGPVSPCQSCTDDSSCLSGARCLWGNCVSTSGDECKPQSEEEIDLVGRGKVPVVGCAPGETATCRSDDHPCQVGESRCFGGVWTPCDQWSAADGTGLGDNCTSGEGVCASEGVTRCRVEEGRHVAFCDATPKAPQDERCNGKDDDCDGAIDEDVTETCYQGPPGTDGVGLCQRGTQTCQAGAWGPCLGSVSPQPEDCNGKDDDCDGQVDEELTRDCYDGPAGTAGVGPCKAGKQRCEAGQWSGCEGAVAPGNDQSCVPILRHTIATSLLSCEASARSKGCQISGQCETKGTQQAQESREQTADLSLRCRGNNSEQCGAFSSEAVVRRSVEIQPDKSGPGSGGLILRVGGFAGSCTCNGWCDKGCSGAPGCCLSCTITAQECHATSSYLAFHHLSWERSLPADYGLVVQVESLKGPPPTLALAEGTTPTRPFQLKDKQQCLLTLPADRTKGITLMISSQLGFRCADGDDYEISLWLHPARLLQTRLPSCL